MNEFEPILSKDDKANLVDCDLLDQACARDYSINNHFGIKNSHYCHITQLVSLSQDTPLTFTQAVQVHGHLWYAKIVAILPKTPKKLS